MKPLIGVPASMMIMEQGSYPGSERYFAGGNYIQAVAAAGGIPIIFPLLTDREILKRHLAAVDGVLLLGGDDVDPDVFGEDPIPKLGPVYPQRDEYELALLAMAREQNKPVLGVCRGMQMINVAFGGSLYQDLPSQYGSELLKHRQESYGYVASHWVELAAGTLLQQLFSDEDQVKTNSFHHQAVKEVAPGFVVSAQANDGVIEGIEDQSRRMLGVQWHPELMFPHHPAMLEIFSWLVSEARAARG